MLIDTQTMLIGMGLRNTEANVQRYDLLRRGVEAAIKKWCKWPLEQTLVTRYEDGNGFYDIVLRHPYVSNLVSVFVDQTGAYGAGPNAFAPATQLTIGQDCALVTDGEPEVDGCIARSGLLRRLSYTLPLFPSDLVFFNGVGGLAYRKPAFWPAGQGNVKIVYTYGFPPGSIPDDLQMAVMTGVAMAANTTRYGAMLTSENLGAHAYSLSLTREPEFATIRQLLSNYRDSAI